MVHTWWGWCKIVMKKMMLYLFAGIFLISLTAQANASWLLDTKKFHMAVHGQTSCQECHENVAEAALHPNPGNVNKRPSDFFNPEKCFSCHDEVPGNIERGIHGKTKIKAPEKYAPCLNCHDPHYQMAASSGQNHRQEPTELPEKTACGSCHESRTKIPPFSPEDQQCLTCHGTMDVGSVEGRKRISDLCFHCHGESGKKAQAVTGSLIPLIDEGSYRGSSHATEACTVCHTDAVGFIHKDQKLFSCTNCHLPHDEKITHDAHSNVSCEACHLTGINPVRNRETGRVLWEIIRKPGDPTALHQMALPDKEASCRRCHFPGNRIGAPAMILPARGLLCMPCHVATFSAGDATTIVALLIFFSGILFFVLWILTGVIPESPDLNPFSKLAVLLSRTLQTIFSGKIVPISKVIFTDVLCQRRLFRRSPVRWFIHGLIFFPFVFRFFWGIIALISSLLNPEWNLPWAMINRDTPITGFLFDLTGLMILTGVGLAFIRGLKERRSSASGLPGQDRFALGLIGGIVLVGFILEGMRIALAGCPPGSGYAFLGYAIGRLFSAPDGLVEVYGFVWYIHAILTGAFVAYLPFSKLFHMIIGPVVLAMNAATPHEGEKK